MKQHIKNYVEQISKEINICILNQFNIKQEHFKNYKAFDFVNFHLINNYILEDNKNDFFISIPEDDYRPNFFSSIFHSLVLIKLYQNFFNYDNKSPILEKGDLIYRKNRVFKITSSIDSLITINYKFPKSNEIGISPFPLSSNKVTKLNPNFVENKNTAKNIGFYKEFLKANFSDNFPLITDFKNKSLVIADKNFFRESEYLPIRYTNKNGKISNDLPFFSYLIECCNDFNSAKNYLLDQNQTFDEIIVIRDTKYRDCFDSILQEAKWRGKVKNIILIGTEKPNSQNDFLQWLWSNDEVKIANNELPNSPQNIKLSNEKLLNILLNLKSEIESIKNENGVNLAFILKYTNFYFRSILVNSKISKGIYQEYCDRLYQYFKGDTFEQEINNLFYDNSIYNSDTIKVCTDRIFSVFKDISNNLEYTNLKWNYVKEKAKEVKFIFLVVDKKGYDVILNQIKNERICNIKLISEKRIDNEKLYLDKWLHETKNTENSITIIPYLNNIELFNKIRSIKGKCEILCYDGIDEISYDNILNKYYNEENSRLTHNDRLKFVKNIFSFNQITKKRELDDVFNFELDNDNFKNNPYDGVDIPKEKIYYELKFTDGTTEKFDSTKGVFIIENGEQIKNSIGEIYEGSTIRFYQNTNPDEFKKILCIFDSENLIDSFDLYSDSWKYTLGVLREKYSGVENLFKNLFNVEYRINYNTFRLYFDKNSQTRFPRIRTLETIRNFCLENNLNSELIVKEFDKFKIYSKKDHSIRQQAGRILGNDLLDYLASNKTEISDSLKKIPIDILDKLTETIQEKTVIKKTLLPDE